ncbi:MAG: HAD-IA family hydrolase [Deltaproteobacteria bacterium]|nr:HAD-IA family hydrolase [Candidatus Zymogenaceae bacterium]
MEKKNEKKEVDLFLFDLDGTLSDSKKDLVTAINQTLVSFGFPELPEDDIVTLIGKGVSKLLSNFTGDGSAKFETFRVYLEHLDKHLLDTTKPFPGVVETLSSITKKKAIVTNKLKSMAERVVIGLGIADKIDLIVGADTAKSMKPNPEPIIFALDRFGVDPSRTVMVGDTTDDIMAAKAAGVIACGVTYGFGTRQDLVDAGAEIIIENIADLPAYFQ